MTSPGDQKDDVGQEDIPKEELVVVVADSNNTTNTEQSDVSKNGDDVVKAEVVGEGDGASHNGENSAAEHSSTASNSASNGPNNNNNTNASNTGSMRRKKYRRRTRSRASMSLLIPTNNAPPSPPSPSSSSTPRLAPSPRKTQTQSPRADPPPFSLSNSNNSNNNTNNTNNINNANNNNDDGPKPEGRVRSNAFYGRPSGPPPLPTNYASNNNNSTNNNSNSNNSNSNNSNSNDTNSNSSNSNGPPNPNQATKPSIPTYSQIVSGLASSPKGRSQSAMGFPSVAALSLSEASVSSPNLLSSPSSAPNSSPRVTLPLQSFSGVCRPSKFNWSKKGVDAKLNCIKNNSRRFLVGFAETIGRRPTMEDCMVIDGTFRGSQTEDYFAVFDGHGGRDAAAFAAENLHTILAEKLKTQNPVKSLREAFVETNQLITTQKIGGGTTACVVLFIGKKGYVANVGDTRAVLCRDGVTHRVSLDHKPELPAETSRIKNLGGTVTTTTNSAGHSTSRVNGMLAVSRALGDTMLHPYVSSEPEIHGPLNITTNEPTVQFMVLACDGVWDVLSDGEAVSIVAPIPDVETAAIRLRDEAYRRGSTDNISVMVIRFPSAVI